MKITKQKNPSLKRPVKLNTSHLSEQSWQLLIDHDGCWVGSFDGEKIFQFAFRRKKFQRSKKSVVEPKGFTLKMAWATLAIIETFN